MKRISWQGVVVFGLAVTATVLVAIYGPVEVAHVLGGLAGGLLLRVGAVRIGGGSED